MRALYILPHAIGGPPGPPLQWRPGRGPPAIRCRRIGRYRYKLSRLWQHYGWLQLHDCHAVDGAALREMVAGEVLPWLEELLPGRRWTICAKVDGAGLMTVRISEVSGGA